jgi:hypothetical protein
MDVEVVSKLLLKVPPVGKHVFHPGGDMDVLEMDLMAKLPQITRTPGVDEVIPAAPGQKVRKHLIEGLLIFHHLRLDAGQLLDHGKDFVAVDGSDKAPEALDLPVFLIQHDRTDLNHLGAADLSLLGPLFRYAVHLQIQKNSVHG